MVSSVAYLRYHFFFIIFLRCFCDGTRILSAGSVVLMLGARDDPPQVLPRPAGSGEAQGTPLIHLFGVDDASLQ